MHGPHILYNSHFLWLASSNATYRTFSFLHTRIFTVSSMGKKNLVVLESILARVPYTKNKRHTGDMDLSAYKSSGLFSVIGRCAGSVPVCFVCSTHSRPGTFFCGFDSFIQDKTMVPQSTLSVFHKRPRKPINEIHATENAKIFHPWVGCLHLEFSSSLCAPKEVAVMTTNTSVATNR